MFGHKVTMNIRVGHFQVKGVITGVYLKELDGTMKYDVAPNKGTCHLKVYEFDLVKLAEGRRTHQNSIIIVNLNTSTKS